MSSLATSIKHKLPRWIGLLSIPFNIRSIYTEITVTLQRAGEFYTWNAPPIVPVIKDRILPLGSLMFIWGEQETFKSWMVLDLAFSVASGQDWLLFETNEYPVLIIKYEPPQYPLTAITFPFFC